MQGPSAQGKVGPFQWMLGVVQRATATHAPLAEAEQSSLSSQISRAMFGPVVQESPLPQHAQEGGRAPGARGTASCLMGAEGYKESVTKRHRQLGAGAKSHCLGVCRADRRAGSWALGVLAPRWRMPLAISGQCSWARSIGCSRSRSWSVCSWSVLGRGSDCTDCGAAWLPSGLGRGQWLVRGKVPRGYRAWWRCPWATV